MLLSLISAYLQQTAVSTLELFGIPGENLTLGKILCVGLLSFYSGLAGKAESGSGGLLTQRHGYS